MKKWNSTTLLMLFTVLAFNNASAAPIDQAKIELINQSSRPSINTQEEEKEEMKRYMLEQDLVQYSDQIPEKEHPVLDETDDEVVNNYTAQMADYYSTTHTAAYHRTTNVSADGLTIEIEDKSVWQVHGWDADKTLFWNAMHTIVLAPNTNIFTRWAYPYKFINLDTHQVVKCKMLLTPVLNDPQIDVYTHWIEDIDYNARLIRLEDGSLWSITWADSSMMRSFAKYNIVIVGTNDGWFRDSCPNVLVCIRNDKYVRGIVIN